MKQLWGRRPAAQVALFHAAMRLFGNGRTSDSAARMPLSFGFNKG